MFNGESSHRIRSGKHADFLKGRVAGAQIPAYRLHEGVEQLDSAEYEMYANCSDPVELSMGNAAGARLRLDASGGLWPSSDGPS